MVRFLLFALLVIAGVAPPALQAQNLLIVEDASLHARIEIATLPPSEPLTRLQKILRVTHNDGTVLAKTAGFDHLFVYCRSVHACWVAPYNQDALFPTLYQLSDAALAQPSSNPSSLPSPGHGFNPSSSAWRFATPLMLVANHGLSMLLQAMLIFMIFYGAALQRYFRPRLIGMLGAAGGGLLLMIFWGMVIVQLIDRAMPIYYLMINIVFFGFLAWRLALSHWQYRGTEKIPLQKNTRNAGKN